MKNSSSHSWLRIRCPKCGSRYRIDRSKIPPQGAAIRCKNCKTRLVLKKKSGEPAAAADHCPKCGFKQKEGEFCYKCGTRIRKLQPKSASNSGPSTDQIPVALIDLNLKYKPALFWLGMAKPIIEIDGEIYPRSWDHHQFQVPPGQYHIKVYSHFIGRRMGEQSQLIRVQKDDFVQMKYSADSMSSPFFRVTKKESNAHWRSLIQRSQQASHENRWYHKPFVVIPALVLFPPIGIYLLWKSRSFEDSHKLIIAIVALFAFLWILINFNPFPS